MTRRIHEMPFGAALLPDGGTRFRLWAPGNPRVELELRGAAVTHRPLVALGDGWHELFVPEAGAGARYQYIVHGGRNGPVAVPDPASRSNPDGVHGASEVVDPRAHEWSDGDWRGRPWAEAVLYELHVGAFTPRGTFAAAQERLAELGDLGITALQLMPLAAFPGNRNWGYDGVLPFAPAACYGSPEELKALIDAAHGLGLMVLLDVVYNHFGPDGNYLHVFCPEFFDASRTTPWGAAINFDGPLSAVVRAFFVHNALFWVEEYGFDGLRLDAVHAMHDRSDPDIVGEIAQALRAGPGNRRAVHLVLENNANQSRYLMRSGDGAPRHATAQWNDDVHHALHVTLSGESDGYYADYAAAPVERLGRALAEGFAYQGEFSAYRHKPRGTASGDLPPTAFVDFLQNHDMIGNRAFGGRIDTFAGTPLLGAAYACLLLSPHVPMLFMGEEFAASTPFLFFCDFEPALGAAVAEGRRREFRRFAAFADAAARAQIPDPNDPASFDASRLRWEERERRPHRERRALVGDLLTLRRLRLVPRLAGIRHGGRHHLENSLLRVEWPCSDGAYWRLLAHFGAQAVDAPEPAGEIIYAAGAHRAGAGYMRLEPGAAIVSAGP